ncbi:MAG TPA: N,N-dimethylformamidase beta subunit family domain-containing protein [Gaiellaceae bacterium]
MKLLAALVLFLVFASPAAGTAPRRILSVDNGATPFAGDTPILTTVSPNGDGFRDVARLHYETHAPGVARVEVDRADGKGIEALEPDVVVSRGATDLSWAPPAGTAPGTYVVTVTSAVGPTAHAVVRVQGVDVAAGRAGYAPGDLVHLAVATDARELRLDVLHIDTSSIRDHSNGSVTGAVVGRAQEIAWRGHADHPGEITFRVGDWPSGVYFARLVADDGRTGYAPIVVRPRRLGTHRIAVVMPTYTWQAYNFYDRDGDGHGDTWYAGWRTFETRLGRPYLNDGVPPHFVRYDLPFLVWAARRHVQADYLTDADLESVHSGRDLAERYDFIVFPGHHEYVQEHEYDVVRGFRDAGGNLAWLSANNFFWKVVRRGPVLERVAQWRTLGTPEAGLIGTQYRANDEGTSRGPLVPRPAAAPWLFAGTPLADGTPWGSFGIEIDHTAPSSPPGTRVLAQVPNLYGPGLTAQMTYYETPAGAKVFAAGAFSLGMTATTWVGTTLLDNLFAHLEQP